MGDTPTWERSNLAARKARLEVRDAVAVLSPKGLQFAVLLRKPLEESSITEQLLKTGTGALNVDASRVFTDWNESDRPDSWKKSGHSAKPEAEKIAAPPGTGINCHPKGRWPANLVLVHGEGCELAGVKKVKNVGGSSSGVSAMGQSSGWNKHNNRVTEIHRNRDKDGLETVANWNCAPGCPVAALDRQSGVLKTNPGVYSGGASRFYRQFKNESELLNYLTALILPETGTLLEGFPS
jgi:site-specific DNA-methyltransferase (adenine-specific)